MRIKGIRERYAEIMTLLSLFKSTVHINLKSLEKCKMRVALLDF